MPRVKWRKGACAISQTYNLLHKYIMAYYKCTHCTIKRPSFYFNPNRKSPLPDFDIFLSRITSSGKKKQQHSKLTFASAEI